MNGIKIKNNKNYRLRYEGVYQKDPSVVRNTKKTKKLSRSFHDDHELLGVPDY